eukprot:3494299-Prymnesium_polylepis.1
MSFAAVVLRVPCSSSSSDEFGRFTTGANNSYSDGFGAVEDFECGYDVTKKWNDGTRHTENDTSLTQLTRGITPISPISCNQRIRPASWNIFRSLNAV